jgi:rare lipoprotein A (peptidoglycan hydrolase)
MTTEPLDPQARSAGSLAQTSTMVEPAPAMRPPAARPTVGQPEARADVIVKNTWRVDGNISWYGPGFYGNRTACGLAMTESLIGVAHNVVTMPVVDRGPYVAGRQFDLTGGACLALDHCFTGSIEWRYASAR